MAFDPNPAIPSSHRVFSSLSFLSDLKIYESEKPYFLIISKDRESDSILTNIVNDRYSGIPITDIRGYEHHFTLNTHGFQLARHTTSLTNEDFESPSIMESKYFPEMEAYLKGFLGAKDVRVMQSIIRERPEGFQEPGIKTSLKPGRKKPLTGVHIDASPEGAVKRIQKLWPLEVDSIVKGRFQILNVWRPLLPVLRDWPLALCDARSVPPEDIVEADLIYPGFEGENAFVYFSPHLKFYFVDSQRRDEIWLFKQYDSMEGVARSTPHGSFQNPRAGAGDLPRLSVDVAVLVIY